MSRNLYRDPLGSYEREVDEFARRDRRSSRVARFAGIIVAGTVAWAILWLVTRIGDAL